MFTVNCKTNLVAEDGKLYFSHRKDGVSHFTTHASKARKFSSINSAKKFISNKVQENDRFVIDGDKERLALFGIPWREMTISKISG